MRKTGVLLPVSSLSGKYGIGSMGKNSYDFIDFLKKSGQSLWQILPVGPTGFGDSPYQSFSAFSGNPYFIDLDLLKDAGLLTEEECENAQAQYTQGIDYSWLFDTRFKVLKCATDRLDRQGEAFQKFCYENEYWLTDYALFMAIKGENDHKSWQEWNDELRLRDENAINEAKYRLGEQRYFWCAVQYLFHSQWHAMKEYANKNGIKIIGDIPIYVATDSSDMWANSNLFQVDENKSPVLVAGCPPDGFSATGQLWGNPLYDWDYHRETGYDWWVKRLKHSSEIFDVTRIDHFRGFAGYYAIPAEDDTAANGHWCQGPMESFISTIKEKLPDVKIIAEDLGFLTPDVISLLKFSGFPGMKVLQFAFDSREESDYLPHNYTRNSVVYTGTHDNTTTFDWQFSAASEDVSFAKKYFNMKLEEEFVDYFIIGALSSVSDTAIIPLQDYLNLDASARINTPSTLGGNWIWRIDASMLSNSLQEKMLDMAKLYGRTAK